MTATGSGPRGVPGVTAEFGRRRPQTRAKVPDAPRAFTPCSLCPFWPVFLGVGIVDGFPKFPGDI